MKDMLLKLLLVRAGAEMPRHRRRSLGLIMIALAASLVFALQWAPVEQQPAGGCG